MSDGRPMKFPYTFSAKIAQFPFKFHWNKVWVFKYTLIATILCIPIFHKLGKASYSKENVEKWEQIRKERWQGHHDHGHEEAELSPPPSN